MRGDSRHSAWGKLSLRDRASAIYMASAVVALTLLFMRFPLSQSVQVILLVILVSVIGLPHGALDYEVAKKIQLTRTPVATVFFFSGYLTLTVLAILAWILVPTVALAVFLVISIYHFSFDWSTYLPRPASLLMSCAVVSLPAIFHTDTVTELFQLLMLPQAHAVYIVRCMFFGGLAAALCLLLTITWRSTSAPFFYGEAFLFCITAFVLPPLLFFLVYFCFLHSMRHMYDCTEQLQLSPLMCYLKSIPMLLLTLGIAYLGFAVFRSGDMAADLLRWVFIGLFGLTIPHMCLLSYWYSTDQYQQIS